jgi:hypothetical protein
MYNYVESEIIELNTAAADNPSIATEVVVNYGNYYKPTVSLNGTVSWEFIRGNLDNVPPVAPINIKGPGVVVLGIEATTGALPDTAAIGDCWAVGSATPYNYYIYNGTTWQNHGQLVGAYFTPTVDTDGNISWSNNASLSNPTTQNIKGPQGVAATITIGTVTTLSPGSAATVQNVGTSGEAIFNFGIPQGTTGATGATGAGVPTGGAINQILKKNSATNYDTVWADAPQSLPTGGALGQLLKKNSATNYDVIWSDPPQTLPTGGATEQVLAKTSNDDYAVGWKKTSHIRTFVATATDWTAITDGYSMTITAATHGMGTSPLPRIFILDGTSYWDSYQQFGNIDWKIIIAANGDITVTTTAMFAGKVVVK